MSAYRNIHGITLQRDLTPSIVVIYSVASVYLIEIYLLSESNKIVVVSTQQPHHCAHYAASLTNPTR